jgi:hypothetical protein
MAIDLTRLPKKWPRRGTKIEVLVKRQAEIRAALKKGVGHAEIAAALGMKTEVFRVTWHKVNKKLEQAYA